MPSSRRRTGEPVVGQNRFYDRAVNGGDDRASGGHAGKTPWARACIPRKEGPQKNTKGNP